MDGCGKEMEGWEVGRKWKVGEGGVVRVCLRQENIGLHLGVGTNVR